MDDIFKFLGILLVGLFLDFIGACLFVFYWNWFIIPIFHIGNISILQSWGLVLTVSLFTSSSHKFKEFSEVVIDKISTLLVFGIFGWILSLFL